MVLAAFEGQDLAVALDTVQRMISQRARDDHTALHNRLPNSPTSPSPTKSTETIERMLGAPAEPFDPLPEDPTYEDPPMEDVQMGGPPLEDELAGLDKSAPDEAQDGNESEQEVVSLSGFFPHWRTAADANCIYPVLV